MKKKKEKSIVINIDKLIDNITVNCKGGSCDTLEKHFSRAIKREFDERGFVTK
jgi:hypothetical protein